VTHTTKAGEVTRLLRRTSEGDSAAEEQLLQVLYAELRKIARRHFRGERPDHTLQPTVLVHEAYMRLMRGSTPAWQDRVHFLATASLVMRRILVDHARRRSAGKRVSGAQHQHLTDRLASLSINHDPERILAVNRALSELSTTSPRASKVLELKFFAGLTDQEAAECLGVSDRTVKRDWQEAKAFVYRALETPNE
jgi:RNA polymerase sigma factor (TIGR02999 family)